MEEILTNPKCINIDPNSIRSVYQNVQKHTCHLRIIKYLQKENEPLRNNRPTAETIEIIYGCR